MSKLGFNGEKARTNLKNAKTGITKLFTNAIKDKASAITLMLAVSVILVLFSIMSLLRGVSVGASAIKKGYQATYETEKEETYQKKYHLAFDRAEKKYHVRNQVEISIGNLEEVQKMEVIKANCVEFITEDRDNNSGNVTAWLEVEGEGTFVADLHAAEFLIDNARQYVLVRLPNPELTNITITRTERRLFVDDWANGSYSEGVDLALKQRNEASLQIQKSLISNQYIFGSAKKVTENMIISCVKQFNPDIPELMVEVEFMG